MYVFMSPQLYTQVLLDSVKRKTYDDELRREELLNYFRRFQGASQKVFLVIPYQMMFNIYTLLVFSYIFFP